MEKAYFDGIRNQILPLINGATDKIQVAMAWFTSSELFDALLQSMERGVEVELILLDDVINFMEYAPDFNEFIKAGGKLRIASAHIGFMHHKFCLIDKKIVITGSYNWTYYAENRNIENVIVTDNEHVVGLFSKEFERLTKSLERTSTSARLSKSDIEKRDDVDYTQLNYEIEHICNAKKRPVIPVQKTNTQIIKTEIKKSPIAKVSIGIQVFDNNSRVIFKPFINAGEKLPFESGKERLFFDSKNDKKFPCLFIYGTPEDINDWHLIKEADLFDIAKGTSEENLPLDFSMRLDDNSSLRVDVSCLKSGQKVSIGVLNSELVKYI